MLMRCGTAEALLQQYLCWLTALVTLAWSHLDAANLPKPSLHLQVKCDVTKCDITITPYQQRHVNCLVYSLFSRSALFRAAAVEANVLCQLVLPEPACRAGVRLGFAASRAVS